MKNKILTGIILSCFISMTVSCNSKNEQKAAVTVDKEQIKKEIQDRENEFAAVYNSGEMKNIGYYADDAVVFSENKAPLIGKPAILDYIKASFDSSATGNVISFKTNDVFPSNDGNQVLEIGYYKLVDSANVPINTGNYMVLFEKRNGKYVSVREMSTSDMPIE